MTVGEVVDKLAEGTVIRIYSYSSHTDAGLLEEEGYSSSIMMRDYNVFVIHADATDVVEIILEE